MWFRCYFMWRNCSSWFRLWYLVVFYCFIWYLFSRCYGWWLYLWLYSWYLCCDFYWWYDCWFCLYFLGCFIKNFCVYCEWSCICKLYCVWYYFKIICNCGVGIIYRWMLYKFIDLYGFFLLLNYFRRIKLCKFDSLCILFVIMKLVEKKFFVK